MPISLISKKSLSLNMDFELVELEELSGSKCTMYSVLIEESEFTLFDQFIIENKTMNLSEINNIIDRLDIIGNIVGAKDHYFKLNEGNLGDGVCALYDVPVKGLRLYCIKFSTVCIILGGGGLKKVRSLQESPKLKNENYLLRNISRLIYKSLLSGDLVLSDKNKLEGNLKFHE